MAFTNYIVRIGGVSLSVQAGTRRMAVVRAVEATGGEYRGMDWRSTRGNKHGALLSGMVTVRRRNETADVPFSVQLGSEVRT